MFADTPHFLKLLRNYVLDEGVTLPNGGVVNKTLLTQVVNIEEARNYKILPKVKLVSHIQVRFCGILHVFVKYITYSELNVIVHYAAGTFVKWLYHRKHLVVISNNSLLSAHKACHLNGTLLLCVCAGGGGSCEIRPPYV